jgi:hypothetical protein
MRSTSTLHTVRWAARILTMALVAGLLPGCMHSMRAPGDLDYSRTRASEGGIYRGTIRPQGDTIPQGRLYSWTLHLETSVGESVDVATVDVDGGMPQHRHGLPTRPRVTRQLGNGDHVVEGMKFNMGGWWVVKFRVRSDAGSDSLVFNVQL